MAMCRASSRSNIIASVPARGSSSPRRRRWRRRVRVIRSRPVSTTPSRWRAGGASPMRYTPRAGASSCNCGTSVVSPTLLINRAAPRRWRRRRSSPPGRCTPCRGRRTSSRRVRSTSTRSRGSSSNSVTARAMRSRRASTAWRSTAPTVISSINSCATAPIAARTPTAVRSVWGADRVAIRLSPLNPYNDMYDSDPETTFGYAVAQLNGFGLAYLHVTEMGKGSGVAGPDFDLRLLRRLFKGVYMTNGGYDLERANAALAAGAADLIAFGVPFLATPDLPARFARRAELNTPDSATFYGGGAHGYIDNPPLSA